MAGQRSKNDSKSATEIPKWARGYYADVFSKGQNAMAQVPTSPYEGRFVAQTDPWQTQGLQARYDAASMIPQNLGNSTIKLGEDMASGMYLDHNTNKYISGMVDAANRDTTNAFNRDLLPRLRGNAVGQGAWGNNRKDIAESLLASETQRNLLDNATNIYGQNYMNERSLQVQAPQLVQAGVQLNQLPGSIMTDIGEYRRQLEQDEIENQLLAYEDRISAPFRGINQMLPVLGLDIGRNYAGNSRTKTSGMFG